LNQRAFNLFTALLALILIILTSVLVTSMVSSESNTKTIISKLIGQSKLEATARLVRADAFQSFNYSMRKQIETHLRDNPIILSSNEVWNDWDEVVDEFAEERFTNESAFANYLGQQLPSELEFYNDDYAAGYQIEVDFNRKGFTKLLQDVFMDSSLDADFFEIIDCDGTPQNCPNGSFYINLKFSRIDEEAYESMPLVTITDVRSGRSISDPVLPRNDLKVYVPLRVFKALAHARGFMHSEFGPGLNGPEDNGFFSPRIHNEFDSMALGMCDYGICRPRDNPYFPPEKSYLEDNRCPGYLSSTVTVNGDFRGENFIYLAGSRTSTKNALTELVDKRLCEMSRDLVKPYAGGGNSEKFEAILQTAMPGECYLTTTRVLSYSTPSKLIKTAGGKATAHVSFYDEPNYGVNPPCPYEFTSGERNQITGYQPRRTGMYYESGVLKLPQGPASKADICKGLKSEIEPDTLTTQSFLSSCSGSQKDLACCDEIGDIEFVLSFREMDGNYKVDKTQPMKYQIKASDISFVPFNPNYDYELDLADCSLNNYTRVDECNADGWTCYVPMTGAQFQNKCLPKAV